MARHVAIVVHDRCRSAYVLPVPAGTQPHQVVEAFRKKQGAAGKPMACSWQAVDGGAVDALIAVAKLQ